MMLITIFGAVGCFVAGSVLLVIGMLIGRQRLLTLGIGLIVIVTVSVLALAVAERKPLLPAFRARTVRLIK